MAFSQYVAKTFDEFALELLNKSPFVYEADDLEKKYWENQLDEEDRKNTQEISDGFSSKFDSFTTRHPEISLLEYLTEKGSVFYYAREDRLTEAKEYLRSLGYKDEDILVNPDRN